MAEKLLSEQSIFLEALEKQSPAERTAYLDEVCGANRQLRADVEALLAANQQLPSLEALPRPGNGPVETVAAGRSAISDGPGTVIGTYKLLEQIGEGGFGLVFMAEQRQPVRRKVALKILKPGMDTRQVVARFEAERQALALMDHPNIAGVYDGGETPSGRPYFVMELVKGLPITEHCDQNKLTPRERLELFIHVCHAVQHAHQKGIIHRDIKPSNLMVTLHDGIPVVKVIDFGIAKATGPQLTEKTLFTNFAQLIGTPEYMSPEQTGQSGLDVDTRSDIYSLGVLLYELLTGRTPLGRKRFKEADYDEIRRLVREEEPPTPSTRVSTLGDAGAKVAAMRRSDPKQLSRLFRGELDWIVMKALEKDRTRRYDTASAMAADVQHYLNDEPVQACPPSAWYRFRKFARRNKGKLVAAACVAAVLAIAAGGVGWSLQERAGRAARTAAEVELVLEQADQLKNEKKWTDAMVAVSRAEGLLTAGQGSAEVQKRLLQARAGVERGLAQTRADQKMSAELVEIRLKQSEVKNDMFDTLRADDDYAAAFLDYGIEIDRLTPEEAAARINKRAIAPELVAALDEWTDVRRIRESINKSKKGGWKHLLAVAKAADSDILRNQVRAALASRDRKTLEGLASAGNVKSLPPSTLALLGKALAGSGASKEAIVFLQRAQLEHPGDFWINSVLAQKLYKSQPPEPQKAIPYYMAALAIRKSPGVYLNLANSLKAIGARDQAIAALQQAIKLKSDYTMAYSNLGNTLIQEGRSDEAITALKQAIKLNQRDLKLNQQDLKLKKDLAKAHSNLGNALMQKGRRDEAMAAYEEAIRLDPKFAAANTNKGKALREQGLLDEALEVLTDAIGFDSKYAPAQYELGYVLMMQRRFDEAIIAFKESIRLRPDYAQAYVSLSTALRRKGLVDEAIAAHEEAIALQPNNGGYRGDLALIFHRQGRFKDALAAFDLADQLGAAAAPYTIMLDTAPGIRKDLKSLAEIEAMLPAILKGDVPQSDAATLMALARYCQANDLNVAAADFFQKAFEAEPVLVADQTRWNRCNAASVAAFAGCGKGDDTRKLDGTERVLMRRQALAWLQSDLDQCVMRFKKEGKKDWATIFRHLEPWRLDFYFPDLRGTALAALPAAERQQWQKLWDDVDELRRQYEVKD